MINFQSALDVITFDLFLDELEKEVSIQARHVAELSYFLGVKVTCILSLEWKQVEKAMKKGELLVIQQNKSIKLTLDDNAKLLLSAMRKRRPYDLFVFQSRVTKQGLKSLSRRTVQQWFKRAAIILNKKQDIQHCISLATPIESRIAYERIVELLNEPCFRATVDYLTRTEVAHG